MASRTTGTTRPGRRASKGRHRKGPDGSIPELSSLEDAPRWEDVHPSEAQRAAYERWVVSLGARLPDELSLGCVCRLDRGFPAVLVPDGIVRAEHATTMAKTDAERPAVGDWVVLRRPAGHDMGVVEAVLPRRSDIARWRGGSRGERQTLAANVDMVLIVQAVSSRPVPIDRIARGATVVADCGSSWAVVLTKADRAPDGDHLTRDIETIHDVLGDEAPVVCLSELDRPHDRRSTLELQATARAAGALQGLDDLRGLIGPGTVSMCLGESGAGKSTLLNALVGHEVLATGKVRSRDDAGRHTTVTRRMLRIDGAGVVIDCPGLRSLPLVGHERGLGRVFPQISREAAHCRFNDCTHDHEPDCAVREALEEGAFSRECYEVYRALADEMRSSARSLDPDVVL